MVEVWRERLPEQPIGIHLIENPRGVILIVSDDRGINEVHKTILTQCGYGVCTAITYTDVRELLTQLSGDCNIDVIVVPTLIHGWHRQEGETRPPEMTTSESDWHLTNIRDGVALIQERQKFPPLVIISE